MFTAYYSIYKSETTFELSVSSIPFCYMYNVHTSACDRKSLLENFVARFVAVSCQPSCLSKQSFSPLGHIQHTSKQIHWYILLIQLTKKAGNRSEQSLISENPTVQNLQHQKRTFTKLPPLQQFLTNKTYIFGYKMRKNRPCTAQIHSIDKMRFHKHVLKQTIRFPSYFSLVPVSCFVSIKIDRKHTVYVTSWGWVFSYRNQEET